MTHVLIGGREACPVNPPAKTTETVLNLFAPLLISLGKEIAEAGVGALSEYVSDATKHDSTALTIATRSTYFYRMRKTSGAGWAVEPNIECITIARGRSGTLDVRKLSAEAEARDPRGRFKKRDDSGEIDFPVLRRLGFGTYPELYFEFAIERDALNTAFRLQPRVVYYRQSQAKTLTDGRVDLNLIFTFADPGSGTPFAIVPLQIPRVQVGVDYPLESLAFDNFSLQPLDDERLTDNAAAAVEYCMKNPLWNLSLQTHKYLGIP